jgi:hypothetical protein
MTSLLAVSALCLAAASAIVAAPDSPTNGYAIAWWTVEGGGGSSSSGPYALGGTIGQADAQTSSGGAFVLTGGFWNESTIRGYRVYLPLILK